jgi:hypothetical protein
MLRVSMDAKASVAVGPFARGGKNRAERAAADHDFRAQAAVTPVGIFLPAYDELFLYGVTSRVTSDCLVDILHTWWASVGERFAQVRTLVLNLDNGPENHSRRTQFMARLVRFAAQTGLEVRLVYYPPYHSKYNPVERCWGVLEQHWNGDLLDSIEAVLGFAASMTWKGKHPLVQLITTPYRTGVKLTKAAMAIIEDRITRLPHLPKWFVTIPADPPASPGELIL